MLLNLKIKLSIITTPPHPKTKNITQTPFQHNLPPNTLYPFISLIPLFHNPINSILITMAFSFHQWAPLYSPPYIKPKTNPSINNPPPYLFMRLLYPLSSYTSPKPNITQPTLQLSSYLPYSCPSFLT